MSRVKAPDLLTVTTCVMLAIVVISFAQVLWRTS